MEHRDQHWIPQSYLGSWADPNCPDGHEPFVWRFTKDGSSSRRKAPKNIFFEKDMYTIRRPDGERDLRLERKLSEIEGRFVAVRREKLERLEPLTEEELASILLFVAAMHARTVANRAHWQEQWGSTLELMDELDERMRNATPEEKRRTAMVGQVAPGDRKGTLSHDQVRALAANPLQHMLGPMILGMGRVLARMHFGVLCTDDDIGFITSDTPCVIYDPMWGTRPPMFQSPGLMDETVEITLPISPSQVVLLSWREALEGYRKISGERAIDETNRRTRFHADEYFVVRRDFTKPIWFDSGRRPDEQEIESGT